MLGTVQKRSGDQLDYDIDASKWIPANDNVVSATAVSDEPAVLVVESIQIASPEVKVWLSGGVAGQTYNIDVVIGTTAGRTKTEQFAIRVRN